MEMTKKLGRIHFGGAVSAILWAILCYASESNGSPSLLLYFPVIILTWCCLLGNYTSLRNSSLNRPNSNKTTIVQNKKNVKNDGYVYSIFFWGLIFRIICLFAAPIYEDDFARYLWDGRSFALTGNPYGLAPEYFFGDTTIPEKFQRILDNINYPEYSTIYGPFLQIVFLVGYFINGGSIIALKCMLILSEIGIFLLLRKAFRASPSSLLLFWWCPLTIQETSISAHPDMFGILPLVASIAAANMKKTLLSPLLLALAAASRPFSLLAALPLTLKLKDSRLKFIAVLGAGILILYAPFLLQEGQAGIPITLFFLNSWEYNSALFGLLKFYLGYTTAKTLCYTVLGLGLASILQNKVFRNRLDLIFGLFFITSAVINPWYILWALPFIALNSTATGITALAIITISYIHGLTLPGSTLLPHHHPLVVRIIEFSILIVVFITAIYKKKRTIRNY